MSRVSALAPSLLTFCLALTCGIALTVQAAAAAVLPEQATAAISQLTDEFVDAPAYTRLDSVEALFGDDWYSEARFPGIKEGSSVFLPDADMHPVQKALMAVDHYEGELPHVRYLISARTEFISDDGYAASPLALVQVTRFNLGPLRRDDLKDSVDEEHLAPASEFGIGLHVSWRFVFSSIQGQLANVNAVSRKELDDQAAAALSCFDQPCLTLEDITGLPEDAWQDAEAPDEDHTGPAQARASEVARLLATMALPDGYGEPVEGLAKDESPVHIVISKDVSGQDSLTTGVLHNSHLMDDALSDIWIRRLQLGDFTQWQESFVYRPGRH